MNDIFNYLNEMTSCLLKIRAYQSVPSVTETCVQPIPQFVPPVNFIAPILFNVSVLGNISQCQLLNCLCFHLVYLYY